MGTLQDDAGRSIVWSVAEKWGARFTNLVVLVVLGRLLSPADFGVVALATTVIALASILLDSGFSKALIQRDTLEERHKDTAFWISLGIALILSIAIAVFAVPISALFGTASLPPVLIALSISLVINSLSVTQAALLERAFNFRGLAFRRLAAALAGGVCAVVVAVLGGGIWALVAQTIVSALVGAIALWAVSSWRPAFSFSRDAARDLWPVGSSIMGIELVGYVNSQSDRIIIGLFLSVETLGYYYMAMNIISILVELFSSVVSNVSLTTFSRLQNEKQRLLEWFYTFTRVTATTAIPVFALTAVTAPIVLPLVLGEAWVDGVPILQALTLLGIINSVLYFDRSALVATGHGRAAFLVTVGQAVLGIGLVLAGVPWGVIGVCLAVLLRQYVFWPVRILVLNRTIGLRPGRYLAGWGGPVVSGAVAAVAAWAAGIFLADAPTLATLFAQVVVFALLYVGIEALVARPTLRLMFGFVRRRLPGR